MRKGKQGLLRSQAREDNLCGARKGTAACEMSRLVKAGLKDPRLNGFREKNCPPYLSLPSQVQTPGQWRNTSLWELSKRLSRSFPSSHSIYRECRWEVTGFTYSTMRGSWESVHQPAACTPDCFKREGHQHSLINK